MPSSLQAKVLVLAGGLLLAACASKPLEEAPVSNAGAGSAAPAATNGQASVAPVNAGRAPDDALGPASAGRVVYFDYDSYAIRPEFRPVLDAHASFLRSHRDRRMIVGGHTDERGGREYNLALGQQRADAVRQALQLLGASPAQIEAISFGEEKPVAPAHEEAAWSRNRRAELGYR